MAWVFNAPSGVYRNHKLSRDIRREAISDLQFARFVEAEPMGKNQGESVTLTRMLQLGIANRVNETDNLPDGRPNISTKQVTVSEWGFKIPMTQKEMDLTHFELQPQFRRLLRDQIARTTDQMIANAIKGTPLIFVPDTTGGTFETDGTVSNASDRNLNISDLRSIHDELRSRQVPTFRNGKYVGILSTRAARGIKSDPEYKDWLAPTTGEPFKAALSGHFADIEGFMLIETNHANALADLVGTSTTTGDGVFFGGDAARTVEVRPLEIEMGLATDLGRFRDIGWHGIMDAFLVWEQSAQARAVRIDST